MSEELKKAYIEEILKCFKKILLLERKKIEKKKNNGNTIYDIDSYNKEIKKFGDDEIRIKNNNYISNVVNYLTSNVLLSDEDIEELIEYIRNGLLKNDIYKNIIRENIYHMINMMIIKDENINEKWYLYLNFYLENNKNLDIRCCFGSNLKSFGLRYKNKYISSLNEKGISDFDSLDDRIKGNFNFYLADDLIVVDAILIDGENYITVLNKTTDELYGVFPEKEIKEIKSIEGFNDHLLKLGFETNEFYSEDEINLHMFVLNNYEIDNYKKLTSIAVNWWYDVIFNNTDEIYQGYNLLLPNYSIEQKNKFKERLEKLIFQNLIDNDNLKLSVIPDFQNKLIKLMNELFIIPSAYSFGKVMEISMEDEEITVTDMYTEKVELLYDGKCLTKNKN